MSKTYNAAPLPFQGQKRNFIRQFKELVARLPDDVIIVDLFGGSGLLSRAAKDAKPLATVIYNDYDNYTGRLADIDRTNAIIAELRDMLAHYDVGAKISICDKLHVKSLIDTYNADKPVDYKTIAANLLFSGKFAGVYTDLYKHTWYNNITTRQYCAYGYLDGLIVEKDDYFKIYNKYAHCDNVVFVIDPPYLQTDVKSYDVNWRIGDYISIIKLLKDIKYIYFTSNRSQIIELLDALQCLGLTNPFDGATIIRRINRVNYQMYYTDIMICNF